MRKKSGPKPDPEYGYRERLKGYSRGPTVSAKTNRILTVWRDVYSLPVGRIMDALMDFACERMDFRIPLKGKRRRSSNVEHSDAVAAISASFTGEFDFMVNP